MEAIALRLEAIAPDRNEARPATATAPAIATPRRPGRVRSAPERSGGARPGEGGGDRNHESQQLITLHFLS